MKLNGEAKISTQKMEKYQRLFKSLIEGGYEISLFEGQREIWIYLNDESGFNLVLCVDGTWRIE